ncbi:MAG: LapA family protein [Chloroflexi bacterium]|nr:LapA family protein [Chloroflexota bacterium]MDK1045206.1 LapA family protein [Anaerolineales bacterium]MCH8341558.1 LapA family protein [Chloroflexota bacterium]MCH8875252.1 LapA family protein [Chloroflexota bacterium]MCI0773148.1 LapA family protein [Chloroflexota bacterium]
MRIFFAAALILALLVTVFTVQNNQSIPISFLLWSIQGSLALVLMTTLVFGILIGLLLMAPGSIRNRLQVSSLQRTVRELEQDKSTSAVAVSLESDQTEEAEHPSSENR